ncbi:MAG: hypothetical protein R6X33_14080 [Candidatus Brocadiia bacterium]
MVDEFEYLHTGIEERIAEMRAQSEPQLSVIQARALCSLPALRALSEVLHEELEGMARAEKAFDTYEEIVLHLLKGLIDEIPDPKK